MEDISNHLSPPVLLGGTWTLVTIRSQHQPQAEEGMVAVEG